MPFAATQKDLAVVILGEVSQRGREMSYGITYVRWSLKCDTKALFPQQQNLRL